MAVDLIVIGGGAAGLGAARTARARGASVVLVERTRLGGDCTFTGCVPSKAVIEAAGRGDGFVEAMAQARRAVETVAATESASVLRGEGVDVVEGVACFTDQRTIDVDGMSLQAGSFVIATGANPAVPAIPGIENVKYLTNETLFELPSLPSSLAVLGGGPVGVEMAQAFARMGSEITVIEAAERLLPREEPLASDTLRRVLMAGGVVVRTGSPVARIEQRDVAGGMRAILADGSVVESDALLVAAGRTPATAELGLENANVRVDPSGFVEVDERLRTSGRGIFAAGDVAVRLQFTHVAYQTGRIAALNALSRLPVRRFHAEAVPWVTFTDPEVARVGLRESEAAACGGRVAFLPLAEVDRAVAAGQTQGFVKIIAGPRTILRGAAGGRLLGATIVAPRAGEMIHEIVLAIHAGMFPARLALTTHAYPTWSMAIQQAAAQFFGEYGGRSARLASAEALQTDEQTLTRTTV